MNVENEKRIIETVQQTQEDIMTKVANENLATRECIRENHAGKVVVLLKSSGTCVIAFSVSRQENVTPFAKFLLLRHFFTF